MAWLGATENMNLRRHVASHIASQITHGMALVTDSRGNLSSSSVTEHELSTLSGSTSNIQAQLNLKSDVRALEAYQPLVTTNSLSMSLINGLVDHVI